MHQDVQALSFSDDSFDIYVSCEVLEHVPDMDRAISEAARILKRRVAGEILGGGGRWALRL